MLSELEQAIKDYSEKYYAGNPEISDAEWDKLLDQLREENPDSEILNQVGWGSGVEKINGKKRKHIYGLVGSLPKYKTFESLPSYNDPCIQSIPACYTPTVISAKLDGLSCVLYYKEGILQYAITRGNGTEGVDITDKVLKILDSRGVRLSDQEFTGALRGELVISIKNWERFKEAYPEYNDPSKNPRNVAAGIINRNEVSDDIEYVSLVMYNMIADESGNYRDQSRVYSLLRSNFNEVCPHVFCKKTDLEGLEKLYSEYNKEYPCDGLVYGSIYINPNRYRSEYNQVAFKFDAESKETVVTAIEWNATRTGRMQPTIIVDTVQLSGTNVSRATAYNAKFVKDTGLHVGSRVLIQKSNEIIPKIIKVLNEEE